MGKVLAALDRVRLREKTFVFFLSDNGWLLGEHGMSSKVLAYEPSMRVPLIVAGPGIQPAVDDHLVLNIDLAPTILDLAGLPVPKDMHGRSLTPLLRGRKTDWRESFVYEAPESELGSWPLWAVRTDRYKYIETYDAKAIHRPAFRELYDLKADPDEMRNLAEQPQHAESVRRLSGQIADHRNGAAGR